MLISFLFLNKNICFGYSLEVPWRGASNEYPQHMFSSRNKKNIMWIPPLICSYVNPFLLRFAYLFFFVMLQMYTDWHNKFGLQLGKKVVLLTGETGTDLKLLAKVHKYTQDLGSSLLFGLRRYSIYLKYSDTLMFFHTYP